MGIQHLSDLPGMKMQNYSLPNSTGIVKLQDENVHTIEIVLKDVKGNTSRLTTKLQLNKTSDKISSTAKTIMANEAKTITTENAEIAFSKNAMYDAVNFNAYEKPDAYQNAVSNSIILQSPYIPVQDEYILRIKANRKLTNTEKDKAVILLDYGSDNTVVKVKWSGDWAEGKFNRLGTAKLLIDNNLPSVSSGWAEGAMVNNSSLVLKGSTKIGDIVSFRAELDGKWLRFARVKDNFVYTFDERCPKGTGSHTLKVTTVNTAGNTNTQTFTFQR